MFMDSTIVCSLPATKDGGVCHRRCPTERDEGIDSAPFVPSAHAVLIVFNLCSLRAQSVLNPCSIGALQCSSAPLQYYTQCSCVP
jgi:hypothetical protein